VPGEGADVYLAIGYPDITELGEAVDVHDKIRRGQAHGHQRDQGLAASKNLCLQVWRR
jgi:hypothetical protein